jgi:holo-[acyl-carrier protein] synthase
VFDERGASPVIFGVGVDIVQVNRMQELINKYGDRFAKRILTANELVDYKCSAKSANFLAKRFAAKEAASKALGIGFSAGLSLRHIGVKNNSAGRPMLEFDEKAKKLFEELGAGDAYISLADERDYAIAYVTLLKKN